MSRNINLSSSRKTVDTIYRKIIIASFGTFLIIAFISLGLIVYRLVLKSTYDALDAKEQKLNSQLIEMQVKKNKIVEIKKRLGDIKKIIAKRSPINVRINNVTTLLPLDTELNGINGTDTDLKISLTGESISSMNTLLEQKLLNFASDKKQAIKRINMNSFGIDPKTLKYKLDFVVSFK